MMWMAELDSHACQLFDAVGSKSLLGHCLSHLGSAIMFADFSELQSARADAHGE